MEIKRTLASDATPFNLGAFVAARPLVHEPRKMRIMVVDDNAVNRRLFGAFVTAHGQCELVHTSIDGLAGMSAVSEHKPDIVLSDLHMPNASGLDLLRHIKREHPSIEVIIISGEANPVERDKVMQAGAHAVLQKPINLVDFHAAIDSARAHYESNQV